MFGLFTPRCPLLTWEKTWTEYRMQWLANRLGVQRLRNAKVIEPTDEYFPEKYEGTPADADRIFRQLCKYMSLVPDAIDLSVVDSWHMDNAVGRYIGKGANSPRSQILLSDKILHDPQALIATLAHELSHEILIGGRILDTNVGDFEWVTDLVPAFLGLGIFAANSAVQESHGHSGNLSWWTVGRQGYLPSRILGYAMALFAVARDEENPHWRKHLRLDASSSLKSGLKYLAHTGDSGFHPTMLQRPIGPVTDSAIWEGLSSNKPGTRLLALWDLMDRKPTGSTVLKKLIELVNDPDHDVAFTAVEAIGMMGRNANSAAEILAKSLTSKTYEVRARAIWAIGEIGEADQNTRDTITRLIVDENPLVARCAAVAIAKFKMPVDELEVFKIGAALKNAIRRCDELATHLFAQALLVGASNPKQVLNQTFDEIDHEMRAQADAALAKVKEEPIGLDLFGNPYSRITAVFARPRPISKTTSLPIPAM